jgi:hypothetical protein
MKQQSLLVDGHINAAKAQKRLCSSGDLLHFLSERPKASLSTLNAAKAQKKLASSGVLLHFWSERPKASLTTLMQRKFLFWRFTAFPVRAIQASLRTLMQRKPNRGFVLLEFYCISGQSLPEDTTGHPIAIMSVLSHLSG